MALISTIALWPDLPRLFNEAEEDLAPEGSSSNYSQALSRLSEARASNPDTFDSGAIALVLRQRALVEQYQTEAFELGITSKITEEEFIQGVSIVEQYKRSVLLLKQKDGGYGGNATAFLISDQLALTNAHNLNALDGVVPETLIFFLEDYNGTEYEAQVLGVDGPGDFALLKLSSSISDLPSFPIETWDLGFREGEVVVSIGNAGTLGNWTSTIGRTIQSMDFGGVRNGLADLNVSPGASGSPVFGLDGRLKGILYASSVDIGEERANSENAIRLSSYLTLNSASWYTTSDEILDRVSQWMK